VIPGRGKALLFGAVGVVVVLLAMGVAWALSPGEQGTEAVEEAEPPEDTTETTDGTDSTDTTAEGEDTCAAEPLDDPALQAQIDEIAAFVEEQRELEFEEPPLVTFAGEGAFQDCLLAGEETEEDEQDLLEAQDELRALGLIEPDVDLSSALDDLLGGGVLGYYDPETRELVVRAEDELSPLARITIAHELTHALDDQHFGLDRPEYDDDPSEVGSGFSSLVEGNASVVEDAYRATLSGDEQDAADDEESDLAGDLPEDVPQILFELIGAPYAVGPDLVNAIIAEGGQAAVDAAFEDPPTTSEQYLFPPLYLAGEEAIEVALPAADSDDVIYEGTFGALGLLLLTDGDVDAVQGWGGDGYVVWRDGDRTCARATFVGDTDADTDEITSALQDWAEGHDDAEVVEGDGDVTFTSCG
jgi:hypothetical protein